ncbi:MAG: DbpA RNA binding domain-containing protein, partial [Bacteroidales bacterium]|nr:DbpA RNA binding domain-containing protein [Bacteroidales bacterium]
TAGRSGKSAKSGKTGNTGRPSGPRKAEKGYARLFINLGKTDGFYPGEIMQYLNRHIKGKQQVGHIDLLQKFCYIEVPERDADRVMKALDGTVYKGRPVRCNGADETDRNSRSDRSGRSERGGQSDRSTRSYRKSQKKAKDKGDHDDWRELMKPHKWDKK